MEQPPLTPSEAQGRYLRLLGREEFARMMGACIEQVLERHGGVAPREARRLRWESLRSFSGLLAARARRVRAVTKSECMAELELKHGALLRERAKNGTEIAGLARELADARGADVAAVLSPDEEASLERALASDLAGLLASDDANAELPRVLAREAERRRAALAGVVARERDRIDQLERRLAKLRAAGAQMEAALAELARRAEIDGGLPSIYRTVQGLAAEEDQREAKAAMLTRMFQDNLVMQHKVLVPQPAPAPATPPAEASITTLVPQQKSA